MPVGTVFQNQNLNVFDHFIDFIDFVDFIDFRVFTDFIA